MSRSADAVGDRVVFDIGGNKYRLVVFIDYDRQRVYVKWLGTHREYDRINVAEV
jgi:mRNA interferase HigB